MPDNTLTNRRALATLAAAAIMLGVGYWRWAAAQPPSPTISGTATTDAPLAGATVAVYSQTTGRLLGTTQAAADGAYSVQVDLSYTASGDIFVLVASHSTRVLSSHSRGTWRSVLDDITAGDLQTQGVYAGSDTIICPFSEALVGLVEATQRHSIFGLKSVPLTTLIDGLEIAVTVNPATGKAETTAASDHPLVVVGNVLHAISEVGNADLTRQIQDISEALALDLANDKTLNNNLDTTQFPSETDLLTEVLDRGYLIGQTIASDPAINLPSQDPSMLDPARLIPEGLTKLQNGNLVGARDDFQAAVDALPTDPTANALLALVLVAANFEEAAQTGSPSSVIDDYMDAAGFTQTCDDDYGNTVNARDLSDWRSDLPVDPVTGDSIFPDPNAPGIDEAELRNAAAEIRTWAGEALVALDNVTPDMVVSLPNSFGLTLKYDYGDARMLKAHYHLLRALACLQEAYEIDGLNERLWGTVEPDNLWKNILENYAILLNQTGVSSARLESGRLDLVSMLSSYVQALAAMKTRTSQNGHLFQHGRSPHEVRVLDLSEETAQDMISALGTTAPTVVRTSTLDDRTFVSVADGNDGYAYLRWNYSQSTDQSSVRGKLAFQSATAADRDNLREHHARQDPAPPSDWEEWSFRRHPYDVTINGVFPNASYVAAFPDPVTGIGDLGYDEDSDGNQVTVVVGHTLGETSEILPGLESNEGDPYARIAEPPAFVGDWSAIPDALVDEIGDAAAGSDLTRVKLAKDDANFHLRLESSGAWTAPSASIDFDWIAAAGGGAEPETVGSTLWITATSATLSTPSGSVAGTATRAGTLWDVAIPLLDVFPANRWVLLEYIVIGSPFAGGDEWIAQEALGLDGGLLLTPGMTIEDAPITGTVNDGTGADIDSQSSTTTISANWSGFSDPQSGIVGYEWAIGTTPGAEDVQAFTSVGLATNASNAALALAEGTTYYASVRVTSGAGLQSTATSDGVTVTPLPSQTVDFHRVIAGGTAATAYRMVSFPVLPGNPDPIANLSDDLGPYDATQWRMWAYDTTAGSYREMDSPSGTQVEPGQGFWLISRDSATVDVQGQIADTGTPFEIVLPSGWNLIGHPFNFPVTWADCEADGLPITDPGQTSLAVELWDYAGAYMQASQLVAGRGYWVRNLGASSVVLSIPPVVASKPAWFREVAFGSGASSKPGGVWARGGDGEVLWVSSGPPPPIPGGLTPAVAGSAATPAATASAGADASGSSPASSGGGGGGCVLASLGGGAGLAGILVLCGVLLLGVALRRPARSA